jgi:methionyl-tRNA formyltransferase
MRIVMMGTGAFALPTFKHLLHAGEDIPLLVTRPVPPPTGRKKETLQPNPMRDFAESQGIPILAPHTTRDPAVLEQLRTLAADLLVVCDFGEILASEVLATARLGGINLHASLLPRYRGAAPINWAILRGEQETGVSVLHMTPQLDGGPVLAVQRTPIDPHETAADLEPRLAALGTSAVDHAIKLLANWDGHSPLGEPQDPSRVTTARRLRKSDGNVRWTRSPTRIHNQLRALQPWPGVFTHWLRPDGSALRLILDRVTPVDASLVQATGQPGEIVSVGANHLWVAAGGGLLAIERLQPAGKRILEIGEFLRGHRLEPGQRFGDPAESASPAD